jgi:hypothetical protein
LGVVIFDAGVTGGSSAVTFNALLDFIGVMFHDGDERRFFLTGIDGIERSICHMAEAETNQEEKDKIVFHIFPLLVAS